jgi:hypothetical protein
MRGGAKTGARKTVKSQKAKSNSVIRPARFLEVRSTNPYGLRSGLKGARPQVSRSNARQIYGSSARGIETKKNSTGF